MKRFLDQFISAQFLRFLIAGGIAASVNFCVGFSLSGLLPFHGDIIVGHLSGMATAFILFESHVFGKFSGSRFKEIMIFIAVNGVAMAQTYLVYYLLVNIVFQHVDTISQQDAVARAIAIITPIFTSFVGHKNFTFKHS